MEASVERCLVCDAESNLSLHSLTDPFSHNEDNGVSAAKKVSGNSTCGTNATLTQQLSVIFLLRGVLRLNKSFLEEILQSTVSNPSLWNLRLCRVCYRTLEEADFVFMRLRKLHAEFDGLSKILCRKLVESVKNDKNIFAQVVPTPPAPTLKRRRAGRGRRRGGWRGKSEQVQVSAQLTVAEKIRREIFKQTNDASSTPFDSDAYSLRLDDSFSVATSFSPSLKPSMKTECNNRTPRVHFSDDCNKDLTTGKTFGDKEFESVESAESCDRSNTNPQDVSDQVDNIEQDNNSDMDYTPDWNPNESNESIQDSDSDFELPTRSTRKSSRSNKRARKSETSSNAGIILKAVKMENALTYTCPKCQEIFENASLCDQHILHKHYGGKWPKIFSCHLCEDVSFKGEYWLRYHYKMRHHGVKWTVDESMERSIDEGTMPELTYEVIPVGQTMSFPEPNDSLMNEPSEDSSLFNRTVDEPPMNAFSIPVVQAGGSIRHLVVPSSVKQLPDVLSLIQAGPEEKPCAICDKRYPTEMQLRAHIKRLHEGETMAYECPLCPKKFERIGKTLYHIQRTHILSKYPCEICGNVFKEEILLKAHVQRNHFGIEYPYKCLKCSSRYPRRSTLNKHLKQAHQLQIASYYLLVKRKQGAVKKVVVRKKKLKLEKKFPCETCLEEGLLEVKFVCEEELDIHIKRRHMGIARPYACSICDKKYSKPSKVAQHMNIHTVRSDLHVDDFPQPKAASLPFVCTPCDKQFRTQGLYNAHLKGRNHHNVRPFVCELCSQGFQGLRYLQNHQSQKHHKELNMDPYKCEFCNKVLSSTRTLNDHIKLRHTKEANYTCPYCDVQFQHKSNRDTHINALHTKTQHFLCPQCPKTFLRDFYLRNHMMRVHSGQKPYECKYCSKKFADKSTYNRHVEAHSNIVHNCPHCGKSGFKTRHALRVHRRTFHKKLLDEMDRKKKLASIFRPPKPQTSQLGDDDNSVSLNNEEETFSSQDVGETKLNTTESQDLPMHGDSGDQLNSIPDCSTSTVMNLFL